MNVVELRIAGVESDETFAAARWELLTFGRICRVDRIGTSDRVSIAYQGSKPSVRTWIAALANANYTAEPIDGTNSSSTSPTKGVDHQ